MEPIQKQPAVSTAARSWPTRFQGMILSWQAGAGAVLALMVIGVLTSTYPARRAALLPPVEALRFEN